MKIKEKVKQSNIMVINVEGGILHRHLQFSHLGGQNQCPRSVKNLIRLVIFWNYAAKPTPLILKGGSGVARGDKLWKVKSPLPPLWSEKSREM